MLKHALPTLLAAASLAACATVGPNFTSPAAPQVSGYAMAGDPAAETLAPSAEVPALWWQAFGSPEIDATVDAALRNNRTLAAADAALARSQALAGVARGGAAPSLDYRGTVARERVNTAAFGIEGFPNPTVSLYSVGAAASFDLDIFGGERRRIESAEARAEAEGRRRDAAYLALSGNVVSNAIEIAELRAQIAAAEDVVAQDQRLLDLVRRAIAEGGQPRAAEVTASAQLAEDEARLPPLRSQLAASRHALAVLVGQAPGAWAAPDFSLDAIASPGAAPVSAPSELVRNRPDILAAEADLHAATADIGVATAALYPHISLGAAFDLSALDPSQVFNYESSGWSIGPSLMGPLFHGGALRQNQHAAQAGRDEAMARYQQTVLTAFAQVSDLMQAAGHDRDLVSAQTRAADAAQEHVRLSQLAYENGAGSLLTVIDAQRQAQRTRMDLVAAKAQLRRDEAALFVAAAADWRGGDYAAR